MNRKRNLFSATGIPSLFLIFAVLCLAVLSLLTLGTSRSSLNSASLSMEQTRRYYEACQKASDTVVQIQKFLSDYYRHSSGQEDYFSTSGQISSDISGITFGEKDRTVSFSCAFSDTQELSVKLQILYPEDADSTYVKILEWKTETTGTWNPDTTQNLYTRQEG